MKEKALKEKELALLELEKKEQMYQKQLQEKIESENKLRMAVYSKEIEDKLIDLVKTDKITPFEKDKILESLSVDEKLNGTITIDDLFSILENREPENLSEPVEVPKKEEEIISKGNSAYSRELIEEYMEKKNMNYIEAQKYLIDRGLIRVK
jgi:hypothetical protein